MMTMLEYLEQDKEKVLNRLNNVHSASEIIAVLNDELNRLLICVNRDCDEESVRDAAAEMIQVAKLAVGFNDNAAGINVYKKADHLKSEKDRLPLQSVLLIITAAICTAGIGMLFVISGPTNLQGSDVVLLIILMLASPFFAALSQRFLKSKKADEQYRTEINFDSDRIWQNLKNIVFAVDRNLKEKTDLTAGHSEVLQEGKGLTDAAEIDFLAELLDAEYSQDGLYALEKLKNVQYYLHQHGIESENFDGSNRSHFDFMPAGKEGTLRPALVKDGKLIKKGLAAEKR